jgi:hypothetical protein|nr:MAG TPA: hypothetical protein [Caudoviricetes sp.]
MCGVKLSPTFSSESFLIRRHVQRSSPDGRVEPQAIGGRKILASASKVGG